MKGTCYANIKTASNESSFVDTEVDNQLDKTLLQMEAYLSNIENDLWANYEIIDIDNLKEQDYAIKDINQIIEDHNVLITYYDKLINLYQTSSNMSSYYLDMYHMIRSKYLDTKHMLKISEISSKAKDEQIRQGTEYILRLEEENTLLKSKLDEGILRETSVNMSLLHTDESEKKIYDEITKQLQNEKSILIERVLLFTSQLKEKDEIIDYLRNELSKKESLIDIKNSEINKIKAIKGSKKSFDRKSSCKLDKSMNESNNVSYQFTLGENNKDINHDFCLNRNKSPLRPKFTINMDDLSHLTNSISNALYPKTTKSSLVKLQSFNQKGSIKRSFGKIFNLSTALSNSNTPIRAKKRISQLTGFKKSPLSPKKRKPLLGALNKIKFFFFNRHISIEKQTNFTIDHSISNCMNHFIKRNTAKADSIRYAKDEISGFNLDYFLKEVSEDSKSESPQPSVHIKVTSSIRKFTYESQTQFTINASNLKNEEPFKEAKSIYNKFFKIKNLKI